MTTDNQTFTIKIILYLYGISNFHFYRWNQFKVMLWSVHSVQETSRNFLRRPTRVNNTAEHHSVAGSQSPSTIKSCDTRSCRMQEVKCSLCTDSRALRVEYCIVGIPHNTATTSQQLMRLQTRLVLFVLCADSEAG